MDPNELNEKVINILDTINIKDLMNLNTLQRQDGKKITTQFKGIYYHVIDCNISLIYDNEPTNITLTDLLKSYKKLIDDNKLEINRSEINNSMKNSIELIEDYLNKNFVGLSTYNFNFIDFNTDQILIFSNNLKIKLQTNNETDKVKIDIGGVVEISAKVELRSQWLATEKINVTKIANKYLPVFKDIEIPWAEVTNVILNSYSKYWGKNTPDINNETDLLFYKLMVYIENIYYIDKIKPNEHNCLYYQYFNTLNNDNIQIIKDQIKIIEDENKQKIIEKNVNIPTEEENTPKNIVHQFYKIIIMDLKKKEIYANYINKSIVKQIGTIIKNQGILKTLANVFKSTAIGICNRIDKKCSDEEKNRAKYLKYKNKYIQLKNKI